MHLRWIDYEWVMDLPILQVLSAFAPLSAAISKCLNYLRVHLMHKWIHYPIILICDGLTLCSIIIPYDTFSMRFSIQTFSCVFSISWHFFVDNFLQQTLFSLNFKSRNDSTPHVLGISINSCFFQLQTLGNVVANFILQSEVLAVFDV